MSQYALIENGVVTNVIVWDGDAENWSAPEGVTTHLINEGEIICIGYTYDGTAFTAPPELAPTPFTGAQVLADRDNRLGVATLRIAPLQDAVDIGEATDAELASLKLWKQYRVALNRIEQQTTFPTAVVWPVSPEE